MTARARASRIWLGGISLGVLAAASAADAAIVSGGTGSITGTGSGSTLICLGVGCYTSQLQTYQSQLEAQPQNATPDSVFVMDDNGGSFQPSLADLSYYAPTARGDYSTVSSKIVADGGAPKSQPLFNLLVPPPNSTWSALEDQAKVTALSSNEATTGVPYERNASWVPSNGGYAINSCQEYVYHSFYDLERWTDAIDACGNDANCKVKFSITGNGRQASYVPEIDRSTLNDSDGYPINARLAAMAAEGLIRGDMVTIQPPSIFSDALDQSLPPGVTGTGAGTMPKNAFYVGTSFFVVPELAPVLAPTSVTALQSEIAKNQYTYAVNQAYGSNFTRGAVGGQPFVWQYPTQNGASYWSQGFLNEWDFHATMNARVAGMTNGEAKEYANRQQTLVNSLQALQSGAIPWCQFSTNFWAMTGNLAGYYNSCTGVGKTPLAPIYVAPDRGDPDPFVTPQTVASSLVTSINLSPALLTPNLGASSQMVARKLVVYPGQGVSGPIPNTPPAGTVVNYAQRAWEILPPMFNNPSAPMEGLNCTPTLNAAWLSQLSADDQLVMKYLWTPVCNVTNVILVEWLRSQAGAPSCYTDSNYRCDWSPQMFVDRFVNTYLSAASASKDAEYEYCKRWTRTDGGSFSSELAWNDPVFSHNANLATFRSLLESRKAAYDKIMKNVPVKAANTLGTEKIDSARIGNSMFSGAYSYDLGWTAQITNKNPDGSACEWGGTLNAEFDANATVMGATEELVSAGVSLSAMPNDTTHTSSGTLAAHLRLIDSDVFTPFSQPLTINGSSASGSVNPTGSGDGSSDEDTISLLGPGVPIQAGPITITINAGIEYGYGANVTYQVNTTAGCQQVPSFGLSAGINPTANFGVWATADATVLGFGAGVEVQLTLIQVGLPLTASVTMLPDQPDPIDPARPHVTAMDTQFGLDLTLSTLGGQMDVYGVVFGFHVFTTPIVTWQGPTWTVPLFHTPEVKIPLPYLVDVSTTATDPTH
jgi:hypothetical protein